MKRFGVQRNSKINNKIRSAKQFKETARASECKESLTNNEEIRIANKL